MILKYLQKKSGKKETKERGENENKLSDLETHKKEMIEEVLNVEYIDLEDMVFRLELTYSEKDYTIGVNYITASSTRYTIPPGNYESSDPILMLNFLLPCDVKVNITIEDIRLRSNPTTNKARKFSKKSIFKTTLGLTQPHSGSIFDIDGFVRKFQAHIKVKNRLSLLEIRKFI